MIDDHLPRDPAAGEDIELHALNTIPNRELADRILTIAAVTTRSSRAAQAGDDAARKDEAAQILRVVWPCTSHYTAYISISSF